MILRIHNLLISSYIFLLTFSGIRNSAAVRAAYSRSDLINTKLKLEDDRISQNLPNSETAENLTNTKFAIVELQDTSRTVIYFLFHPLLPPQHKVISTMDFLTSTYGIVAGAIVVVQAAVLKAFGQPLISKSGFVKLWVGEVSGPENSQHVTDWYTFSHVLHGFIFYEILYFVVPSWSIGLRFVISVFIEAVWEVIENLPSTIERYRKTALAQGYVGDSILNSVCDSFAIATGFLIADKLPLGAIIALALASELVMALVIRDNLTLNVIQLVRPIDAITRWQSSGSGSETKDKDKKNRKLNK